MILFLFYNINPLLAFLFLFIPPPLPSLNLYLLNHSDLKMDLTLIECMGFPYLILSLLNDTQQSKHNYLNYTRFTSAGLLRLNLTTIS